MPLILSLLLMQILSISAWPVLGRAAMNNIAAAVVPTIQRHTNFEKAGMLTPSIFFCPLAVLRSDNEIIHPLLQPLSIVGGGLDGVIQRPAHVDGGRSGSQRVVGLDGDRVAWQEIQLVQGIDTSIGITRYGASELCDVASVLVAHDDLVSGSEIRIFRYSDPQMERLTTRRRYLNGGFIDTGRVTWRHIERLR